MTLPDSTAFPGRPGVATTVAWRVLAFVVVALAVAPSLAQTGAIDVCASDEENQPLLGATATVSNERRLTPTVSLLTAADGCALFPVLRAGSGYAVEISRPGFMTYRFTDIRVSSGQTFSQRVVLMPAITERVEVSGGGALVDLDRSGSTTRFDDTFIEHLPVPGRFYQNILTLAPGVLDGDGDGNPNVHGARERNFRAVVDGVANTDPLTGEWISLLNSDSIEEMEVVGTGAGVEFGRASGGFARVIQKQGSNEFEGLVSMIFRSSRFDGGASGDVLTTAEGSEFEWIQPAVQLTGPIVRDRLWYRLSHEWIDREDPINTLNRVTKTTRTQAIASDQLTWQVTPRNKVSWVFQADPTTIENFGVSSRVPPQSSQRLERDGPTYKVTWTAPISPRLLVDTTVAHQDLERGFFPMASGVSNDCALFGDYIGEPSLLNNVRCFNPRNGLVSGGHNEIWEDRRQRLTVSTQVTWFTDRIFGVSHRFKLGFTSENERFFRSLVREPSIVFEVEEIPLRPDIARSNVRVSAPPQATNSATGNNYAFYLEDQIKPVPNLSLTVGLRYDREEIFSRGLEALDPVPEAAEFEETLLGPVVPNISTLFPRVFTGFTNVGQFQRDLAAALGINASDVPLGPLAIQSAFWVKQRQLDSIAIINNNVSPRLSLAWDPWSDGKTKFALTAGRYFDKIFLAIPLIELEPPIAELEYLAREDTRERTFVNIGQLVFSPAVTIHTVDRGLRTPYQDELAVSFEREIALETVFRATWIKRDFRDQIQDIDINHATGDKGRCIENFDVRFPVVVTSIGEGRPITDPFTGEIYTDTDPGPGDGVLDDCTGNAVRINNIPPIDLRAVPDGLPDLYVLNPGWGEILEVGNNNTTEYQAWVLELVRRLYRDWQMALSYTWSEAVGDAEDFDQVLGNERNLFEQERGFLAFDQTHVFKANAMKTTQRGWQLGGTLRWESGLPYSVIRSEPTLWSVPPLYAGNGSIARDFRFRYPSGARNDERNPSYWTLDLRVAREFRIKNRLDLRATIEVFNVLDDQTLIIEDRIDQTLAGTRRFGRQFQFGLRIGF